MWFHASVPQWQRESPKERGREGERERERESERQRERGRETETERERERDRNRKREREKERERERSESESELYCVVALSHALLRPRRRVKLGFRDSDVAVFWMAKAKVDARRFPR